MINNLLSETGCCQLFVSLIPNKEKMCHLHIKCYIIYKNNETKTYLGYKQWCKTVTIFLILFCLPMSFHYF